MDCHPSAHLCAVDRRCPSSAAQSVIVRCRSRRPPAPLTNLEAHISSSPETAPLRCDFRTSVDIARRAACSGCRHQAWCRHALEHNRVSSVTESNDLMVGAYVRPVCPMTIDVAFRVARATVTGLPEGFRAHDLRHYFASLLIAADVTSRWFRPGFVMRAQRPRSTCTGT